MAVDGYRNVTRYSMAWSINLNAPSKRDNSVWAGAHFMEKNVWDALFQLGKTGLLVVFIYLGMRWL